jgi:hypothetical protein
MSRTHGITLIVEQQPGEEAGILGRRPERVAMMIASEGGG